MQYGLALLLKVIALLLVSSVLASLLFLYFSSIKVSYEEGQHFGFKIGDSQEVVFGMLPGTLRSFTPDKNKNTFRVELYNVGENVPILLNSQFTPNENPVFLTSYKWSIYFDSKFFFDSISLTFCDNKLCKISRKKQYLEIP